MIHEFTGKKLLFNLVDFSSIGVGGFYAVELADVDIISKPHQLVFFYIVALYVLGRTFRMWLTFYKELMELKRKKTEKDD